MSDPLPARKPVGFRKPEDVIPAEHVAVLNDAGWVIVRKSTKDRWAMRTAIAEQKAHFADIDAESARGWARKQYAEVDRLSARCTFLYEQAIAHGANRDELSHEAGEDR
jgi:hypothetical protein